jgi:hypothetical protein
MSSEPARPGKPRSRLGAVVTAWLALSLVILLANGMSAVYWGGGIEMRPGLTLIIQLAMMRTLWRLLKVECEPFGVRFPLDVGMFLALIGLVLVPYYLWRAQRWLGLAKTLLIASIWLFTYAITVGGMAVLLWLQEG